jgi:hypothetical protein
MDELLELTTDPFLSEKSTTDAFVGIVADFCEHFESLNEIVEGFSIVNGKSICAMLTFRICHCARFTSSIARGTGI